MKLSLNTYVQLWFTDDIPEHEVGRLTLNRNSDNYFAEVEQSAFDPANMPIGIEPSPDKLLQGRLFSYLDTQYYRQELRIFTAQAHAHSVTSPIIINFVIRYLVRLGVNFNQLPVNQPANRVIANHYKDGRMTYDNDGGTPNYNPNSFLRASAKPQYRETPYPLYDVVVDRHVPPNDNFFQVRHSKNEWFMNDNGIFASEHSPDNKRFLSYRLHDCTKVSLKSTKFTWWRI